MKARKLLQKALRGPEISAFADLCSLATALGYRLDRTSGSHHIFVHLKASRPLNLPNVKGQAKPYQVRQLLHAMEEFNLQLREDLS